MTSSSSDEDSLQDRTSTSESENSSNAENSYSTSTLKTLLKREIRRRTENISRLELEFELSNIEGILYSSNNKVEPLGDEEKQNGNDEVVTIQEPNKLVRNHAVFGQANRWGTADGRKLAYQSLKLGFKLDNEKFVMRALQCALDALQTPNFQSHSFYERNPDSTENKLESDSNKTSVQRVKVSRSRSVSRRTLQNDDNSNHVPNYLSNTSDHTKITGKEKSTLHKRLDCTRKCSYYRTPPSQRKSSLRDLKYVVEEEKRRRGLQSDFPKRKRNFIRYRSPAPEMKRRKENSLASIIYKKISVSKSKDVSKCRRKRRDSITGKIVAEGLLKERKRISPPYISEIKEGKRRNRAGSSSGYRSKNRIWRSKLSSRRN